MKKSIISLFTLTAFVLFMTSCGGKKAKEDEAKAEEAAVVAGQVSKSLLTEEVKAETILLLKDMPSSEIPYRIATGEVTINVGDTKFMLPLSKSSELTSNSQKARVCGMYFADYFVLKAMKQKTTELEIVLAKLAADLNIAFMVDILKETAPEGASKEEYAKFLQAQESRIFTEMANGDRVDVQIELLSGVLAESACVYSDPSLVVKGDATSAGLSDNMVRRLEILKEVIADLATYYPNLEELGQTISPLDDKITTINIARSSNAEIIGIRNALLK